MLLQTAVLMAVALAMALSFAVLATVLSYWSRKQEEDE
jgi:hypothetical protein